MKKEEVYRLFGPIQDIVRTDPIVSAIRNALLADPEMTIEDAFLTLANEGAYRFVRIHQLVTNLMVNTPPVFITTMEKD